MARGTTDIAAMILAAGAAEMSGPAANPLAEYEGRSLLRRAVESFRLCGMTRIVAVTGHQREAVAEEAEKAGARVIFNPDYAGGLISSMKAGLPGVAESRAFFMLPVEAALIHPQTILSQISWWLTSTRKKKNRSVLVPVHDGRCGRPALIGGGLVSSLEGWAGEGDLLGWLASLTEDGRPPVPPPGMPSVDLGAVSLITLPDPAILTDIYSAELPTRPYGGCERPSLKDAWQFLQMSDLKKDKLRHSVLVARGALRLALAMNGAGLEVDAELCVLAGVLHDLARREKKHARQGRVRTAAMGWPDLALVVGAHSDPPPSVLRMVGMPLDKKNIPVWASKSDEQAYAHISDVLGRACLAVYLADKYLWEDTPATIVERFNASRAIFWSNRAALKTIARRERTALAVEAWFGKILGLNPKSVVAAKSNSAWEDGLEKLMPMRDKRQPEVKRNFAARAETL
ncbi:hypothetical protein C4J81_04500 [Deltaproteobacteria bacterium Smac51]|nr:hypothetical protein C4J81_04500 [Deltaproteobacteria bacterium Smac51]